MNFKTLDLQNLYSARGAKRGLRLAGVGLGIWLIWAAGYIQGRLDHTPVYVTPASFDAPIETKCCTHI